MLELSDIIWEISIFVWGFLAGALAKKWYVEKNDITN